MTETMPAWHSHPPGELSNTFAALPDTFYARVAPTPVLAPRLLRFNAALAADIGLEFDEFSDEALAGIFSGNVLPAGADPVAMAYAGHQFGNFVPRLGDGRAILLAEVVGPDGIRRDLHLKGSGRTPFSRGGDGRAALGPVLREYIVSEAMHALGIPTTRALAAIATGERIVREGSVPGAIVARVAQSHIRIGTFEFHAARGDNFAVRRLADYVIDRHYPDLRGVARPYLALLATVAARQAVLVAAWMRVGFIHGVMNTDNMSIVGETIDFGPCAFMDEWDPATVYSAIDRGGRYAYANQPAIAQWNLARLAETLLPLIDDDVEKAAAAATDVLVAFMDDFERRRGADLRAKIGLGAAEAGDLALVEALLELAHAQSVDHTLLFWHLGDAATGRPDGVRTLFTAPATYDAWAIAWQARLAREAAPPAEIVARMRAVSPAIIPRNHQVERALRAAIDANDLAPFHALVEALAHPYADAAGASDYATPPRPEQRVLQTFCGT
jgi:uncharacterized protein YdiU (UPF0061 family)